MRWHSRSAIAQTRRSEVGRRLFPHALRLPLTRRVGDLAAGLFRSPELVQEDLGQQAPGQGRPPNSPALRRRPNPGRPPGPYLGQALGCLPRHGGDHVRACPLAVTNPSAGWLSRSLARIRCARLKVLPIPLFTSARIALTLPSLKGRVLLS